MLMGMRMDSQYGFWKGKFNNKIRKPHEDYTSWGFGIWLSGIYLKKKAGMERND